MAAAISADTRATFRFSFFLGMTIVMALFIFSGFGLTYWMPMAAGSLAPLPPVVHLHGAFFFSWMVLPLAWPASSSLRVLSFHNALVI